jgi:hypothetical protein
MIKGHYAQRDAKGRFTKWTNVYRSINVDKRRKAKKKGTEPGYGHELDYPPK